MPEGASNRGERMTTIPGVEDKPETAEQPTEADRVRNAFAQESQEPRKGPGRPKGSKTGAKARSEQARRAALAGVEKRRQAQSQAMPIPAVVSPEEARFWGEQLASFWNQLAFARGYPMMPGASVDAQGLPKPPDDPDVFLPKIGDPVARSMQQLLPTIDERPWLQVLVMMAPFIGGAVRVEIARATAARRSPASVDAGNERGRVRTQGQRQDDAREDFIGAPILQTGADS